MTLCGATVTCAWSLPRRHPDISTQTVHVWRAVIDRLAGAERLRGLLTVEELDRAAAYHFTRDREHFIASRGLLRLLLGRYLHLDPAQLSLLHAPGRKPELAAEMLAAPILRFNVARSDGVALLAFALDRHVGVDVERVRPDVDADSVAETFFAPVEVAALRALPASLQPAAFFEAWTHKEAYVKATGEGLAHSLAGVRADGSHDHLGRWSIRTLHPAEGYTAALVVEGHDWELRLYDVGDVLD